MSTSPPASPQSIDTSKSATTAFLQQVIPWFGSVVWIGILAVPLLLTSPLSPISYQTVFPAAWYEYDHSTDSPKPLGLSLGIITVAVGQVFVLIYFYLFKHGYFNYGGHFPASIQTKGAREYEFQEGLFTHLAQPEGFVLLGLYLSVTWMMKWMPASYYSFEGGIQLYETFACLVLQDGLQYAMHRLEHVVSPTFYQKSHKPHHRFTNPRLFDAFNGSVTDTVVMILIPLIVTSRLIQTCNVWSYMAFGTLYANWLTLIHSEHVLPWDGVFRAIGFGTPGDHHVHHKFFKYNYGHLFMWFDQLCGTYKNPQHFSRKAFTETA